MHTFVANEFFPPNLVSMIYAKQRNIAKNTNHVIKYKLIHSIF